MRADLFKPLSDIGKPRAKPRSKSTVLHNKPQLSTRRYHSQSALGSSVAHADRLDRWVAESALLTLRSGPIISDEERKTSDLRNMQQGKDQERIREDSSRRRKTTPPIPECIEPLNQSETRYSMSTYQSFSKFENHKQDRQHEDLSKEGLQKLGHEGAYPDEAALGEMRENITMKIRASIEETPPKPRRLSLGERASKVKVLLKISELC